MGKVPTPMPTWQFTAVRKRAGAGTDQPRESSKLTRALEDADTSEPLGSSKLSGEPTVGESRRSSNTPKEIGAARITGLAALVGALVAAAGAVVVPFVTQSAEDARAKTAFLRDQQRAVYSTFVTAEEELRAAEGDWYYSSVAHIRGLDAVEALNKLTAAEDKYRAARTSIKLIGSPAAVGRADDLDREFNPLGRS